MDIVLPVTGITIGWRIAVKLGLVAFPAFDLQMHAQQWKTGAPMVDAGSLPSFLVMAGFALFTELSFVHILFLVARDAGCRCFNLAEQRLFVAGHAFHRFMLAQQLEFRFPVMVEFDLFP